MNKEIMYKFYRTKTGKICRYEVESNGMLERKRAKAKVRSDKTQERVTGVTSRPILVDRHKKGTVTFDEGFKRKDKKDELKAGGLIKNKLRRSLHHLKEKSETGVKNPDLLMDGKYSEIKTSRGTDVDKLVRKGIKQTNEHGEEKAGDIYLNLYSTKSTKQEIDRQIRKRMARSYKNKKTKTIVMWRGNYKEYEKK